MGLSSLLDQGVIINLTVVTVGGMVSQSIELSSHLGPRCQNPLNCRHCWGQGSEPIELLLPLPPSPLLMPPPPPPMLRLLPPLPLLLLRRPAPLVL